MKNILILMSAVTLFCLVLILPLFVPVPRLNAQTNPIHSIAPTNSTAPPTQGSQTKILEKGSHEQTRAVSNQTFIISLVVALGAIFSPLLMGYLTNRASRLTRLQDYERQDVVADRAEKAAKVLAEYNKAQAKATAEIKGTVDIIHTLSNAAMTSAIQRELDALTAQAALMEEVVELRKQSGQPKPAIVTAVMQIKEKMAALERTLQVRAKQSELVEAQLKSQEATAERVKSQSEKGVS